LSQRTQLRVRMKREAYIASHLSHRAITNYIGLFVEEGSIHNASADFYLVSGYVNRGTARSYLAENRSLKVSEQLVSTSDIIVTGDIDLLTVY
jgi:serine/threonine protein kinase